VPDVRKEVLNESEKESQQAVRVVQTEMESALAANKEILGRGSPEGREKVFEGRTEKLEKELEKMQEAKADLEAMQVATGGATSFGADGNNKKVCIGGEAPRKEKQ
jgi:hypothetical protein